MGVVCRARRSLRASQGPRAELDCVKDWAAGRAWLRSKASTSLGARDPCRPQSNGLRDFIIPQVAEARPELSPPCFGAPKIYTHQQPWITGNQRGTTPNLASIFKLFMRC